MDILMINRKCMIILNNFHGIKSVPIRSFSGLYFPEFGLLNTVFSPNAGKMRTKKTPNMDTFHAACSKVNANHHKESPSLLICGFRSYYQTST